MFLLNKIAVLVDSVDFCMRANRKGHHTNKFEVTHCDPPEPVLRRGQACCMSITFKNRPYKAETDVVSLVFKHASGEADLGVRTITLTERQELPADNYSFAMILEKQEANTIHLQIKEFSHCSRGMLPY